jgi:uncharacterized protein DUF3179
LCHTGLVWKSTQGGRTLHFHLTGINNQNFIMRDEETGSWWQQVTGCAIIGPLKGQCLEAISWDEVTFALFRQEHPGALVLRAAPGAKDDYAEADWEKKVADYPTVTPVDSVDVLKPRDVVVGVAGGKEATAYPWTTLVAQNPILDTVGDTPLLILLHPDGRSLRCFDRRVEGATLELFLKTGTTRPMIVDDATGSEWDFTGLATAGPMAGRRLARVTCLKDFWFDWKTYNPRTRVYAAGTIRSQ